MEDDEKKTASPVLAVVRAETDKWSGQRVSEGDDTTDTAGRPVIPRSHRDVLCLSWVHPEQTLTPLASARTTFGRGPDCDVRLTGRETSRSHALVERSGNRFVLRDLDSKNGTLRNGQLIAEESALVAQDVVRMGEWVAVAVYVPAADVPLGRAVRPLEVAGIGGPALNESFQQLKRVARTNLSTILVGETGTGKEIFARALHELSARSGKFIGVNCAAVPESLAEAELFGCRKGAYTGADRNRAGYLREASGGTLFLDEVCDLPPAIQAKLLRALQDGAVTPLGESQALSTDVRVVCAAQARLDDAVAAGRFRADLYARLSGAEINLPPLRTRREEIIPLFTRTLAERCRRPPVLSPRMVEWLCLYEWPFNVREVVQTAAWLGAELGEGVSLDVEDLPERMLRACNGAPSSDIDREGSLTRAERHRRALRGRDAAELDDLLCALELAGGNISVAAKGCGISRQRAYRLLESRPEVDVDALRAITKLDTSDA